MCAFVRLSVFSTLFGRKSESSYDGISQVNNLRRRRRCTNGRIGIKTLLPPSQRQQTATAHPKTSKKLKISLVEVIGWPEVSPHNLMDELLQEIAGQQTSLCNTAIAAKGIVQHTMLETMRVIT